MIIPQNTQLVIIDIQGKLARIVVDSEKLIKNVRALVQACQIMEIPIVWVEQNPKGLGPTVPELSELLLNDKPISKMNFSVYKVEDARKTIQKNNRKDILITGIETHICVYQTSADLIQNEYNVHVIADAVSSRTVENKSLGIEKIRDIGGNISGTEMIIFELLQSGENENFKRIQKLII